MSKAFKGSLILFFASISLISLFVVFMTAYVNGNDRRVKHETIPYEKLTTIENIPEGGVYIIARTDGQASESTPYKTWNWQIKDSNGNYQPSDLTYTVQNSAYKKMDGNLISALENHRDCELKLYPGSGGHWIVDSVMNIEAYYLKPEIFLFILLGGLILAVMAYRIQKSDNKQSKKTAAAGGKETVFSRGFNEPDSTQLSAADVLAVERDEDGERKEQIKQNGQCDGDCSHCPPHYGYRYGRWYYGHDHTYGCERGGNRGGGGF